MNAVNFLPDILLIIYIGLAAFFTARKRSNSQTHDFDRYFSIILTPYIILTGLTSAAFSINKYTLSLFLITSISVTLLVLFTAHLKDRKKAYIAELMTGLVFLSVAVTLVKPYINLGFLLEIILLTLIPFAAIYLPHIKWKKTISGLYLFPIFTHFFDAASTVKALEEGLNESQFLARIFIEYLGPNGIFIMKALIFIPLSYYVSEQIEENMSRDLLYMIGVYGLVLGLRNFFLLSFTST